MAEPNDQPLGQRRGTCGILRIDVSPKGAKTQLVPIEMKMLDAKFINGEPVSPQPSVDRLSVTFANETPISDSSAKSPAKGQDIATNEKVRFYADPIIEQDAIEKALPAEEDDEEYSASVSAIMSRSASTRRSGRRKSVGGAHGRRPSSPFSHDIDGNGLRRRSSAFTTSSAESGLSTAEENTAQEMIFHKMKIHKEVLSQIKYQPWPMRKKIRLVQTAKAYIKRHEGALHERLAQKKSTKDVMEHVNIILINQWHRFKREVANLSNTIIPWEKRIKQIESHFGSAVASYFTFLRWLFWVNLVSAMALVLFVALPELLLSSTKNSGERKELLPEEERTATNLVTLWNFQGRLKYSPFFYGYYMSEEEEDNDGKHFRLRLPTAYFITGVGVYIYSFIAVLRKMAENSRQSKLSEKEDECVFSWKIFTAWDYMIGNPETAYNRTASIILGFKEVLLEEAEKNREDGRNWKMTVLRTLAHFIVVCLIVTSVYVVVKVVRRSLDPEVDNWLGQSEVTLVFTIIGFIYPILFDAIGYMERYHPRKALRMQLARIMVLNLLNLHSFIFATFSQIHRMSEKSEALKPNVSRVLTGSVPTTPTTAEPTSFSSTTNLPENCFKFYVDCNSAPTISSLGLATLLVTNLSTTVPGNGVDNGLAYTPDSLLTNISTELPSKINATEIMHFNTSFEDEISITQKEVDEFWREIENSTAAYNHTTWTESNLTSIWPNTFLFSNFSLTNANNTFTVKEGTIVSERNHDNISSTMASFYGESSRPLSLSNDSKVPGNIDNKDESDCFVIRCHGSNVTIFTPRGSTVTLVNRTNSSVTVAYQEPDAPVKDMSTQTEKMDLKTRKELRDLCWETMFGQELVKLTVMDLVATVSSILMMDFFRAIFVRVMNHCWCWDLEKTFPLYGDFKIAENILHLVNNQGMVWMGMFFSPLLPLINIIKLIIILYMRSWAVMTCNVPHEVVFKASRSNNFYFALLLTMLFLCVLPVSYAIVWIQPSWHCGPFSNYRHIYHLFTSSLKKVIPKTLHKTLDYIASPGIVIPLLMLLVLIIYYLISLTNALREANNDLKIQLRRERTEERRKVFQLADKRRRGTDFSDSNFNKWNKLLESVPEGKISRENSEQKSEKHDSSTSSKKGIFRRLLKKASKSSNNSEEGVPQLEEDIGHEHRKNHHHDEIELKNEKRGCNEEDNWGKTEEVDGLSSHHESNIKRLREDSITSSVWFTDHIPEIKIVETGGDGGQIASGSKSSSVDTVVAVGIEDGVGRKRQKAPLARSKLNSDDLTETRSDSNSETSYQDIPESIRKIHSLTNVSDS